MKLQTKIPFQKQEENLLIDYNSQVLLLGSCFTEHIGEKLDYFKLKSSYNPFGILFHPLAIKNLVDKALNGEKYSEQDIFCHNEQWNCFDVHSRLSNVSKEDLLNNLNIQLKSTNEQLSNCTHIVITLGTAWVYKFIETNQIVANCHKIPQKKFRKELLTVKEIVKSLNETLDLITKVNPSCIIIFTVSPIRHLKDGFVENTRSKAHLIAAIHQSLNQQSFYFPSYEIMIDELRDYRFFNEDMLHPNSIAVDYIWEKFNQVWFTDKAISLSKRIEAIQKSLNHKPFNPNSEGHKSFLEKLDHEKRQIIELFPHISF